MHFSDLVMPAFYSKPISLPCLHLTRNFVYASVGQTSQQSKWMKKDYM